MALTFAVACEVLAEMSIGHVAEPEGITLTDGWVLRQGSGAAGTGNSFTLWHLPTNHQPDWPRARTAGQLRRLLQRWQLRIIADVLREDNR